MTGNGKSRSLPKQDEAQCGMTGKGKSRSQPEQDEALVKLQPSSALLNIVMPPDVYIMTCLPLTRAEPAAS